MKIYLTGFMGSGKSTYGQELASALGYSFIDLDEKVEAASGASIPEIFKEKGEEHFRLLESEELKKTAGLENAVIATGGGTPCFHNQAEWMNEQGKTVYLKLFETELYKRLKDNYEARPLLKDIPEAELQTYVYNTLRKRAYHYHKAKIVIDPLNFTPLELAEKLQS